MKYLILAVCCALLYVVRSINKSIDVEKHALWSTWVEEYKMHGYRDVYCWAIKTQTMSGIDMVLIDQGICPARSLEYAQQEAVLIAQQFKALREGGY